MTSFVRMTILSNVGGRADYITDTERQENIVLTSPPIDWNPYQDFERTNPKTDTKNNEGRELIIALPNEWKNINPANLETNAQRLAVLAIGKGTDMQWAIHDTAKENNLHMHVVFSERTRALADPSQVHTRDVYLTDKGTIARNKAERSKNPDGTDKPPAHRKGDAKYKAFTPKDRCYKDKGWLYQTKGVIQAELQRIGAVIDPPQPIRQYHEGKGPQAARIREVNAVIKMVNTQLQTAYIDRAPNVEVLRDTAISALTNRRFPAVIKQAAVWLVNLCSTAKDAIAQMTAKPPEVKKTTGRGIKLVGAAKPIKLPRKREKLINLDKLNKARRLESASESLPAPPTPFAPLERPAPRVQPYGPVEAARTPPPVAKPSVKDEIRKIKAEKRNAPIGGPSPEGHTPPVRPSVQDFKTAMLKAASEYCKEGSTGSRIAQRQFVEMLNGIPPEDRHAVRTALLSAKEPLKNELYSKYGIDAVNAAIHVNNIVIKVLPKQRNDRDAR